MSQVGQLLTKLIRHILGLARLFWRDLRGRLAVPGCIREINALDEHENSRQLVDFAQRTCSGLIWPAQIPEEATEFLDLLKKRRVEAVLEIGTFNGGTLFLFTRVVAPDAILISLDLPKGQYGGGYPEWKLPLFKAFRRQGQKVCLLREDSHLQSTLSEVEALLEGRPLDLLFIDGDHSYEGVKRDFELYSPLVAPDGLIVFHDIVDGPPEYVGGVHRFWSEIRQRYPNHREIIADPNQPYCGIGILYV